MQFMACGARVGISTGLIPIDPSMCGHPGNSIYIFATLVASLSSLDMLFSPCVLPIGVCKIAIHLYTLQCTAFNIRQIKIYIFFITLVNSVEHILSPETF